MDILTLILTSAGLAMDAFSVSVSSGIFLKKIKFKNALKIGLFFGFFQFLMPCIGWLLGCSFQNIVEVYAPWIAFLLLGFIGGKMLHEATHPKIEEMKNPLDNKVLLILAIATSIDALAVGIPFARYDFFGQLGYCAFSNSIVIGIVSLVLSTIGVYIGNKCGDLFGNKAEIAGGIVLIAVGIKILAESFI